MNAQTPRPPPARQRSARFAALGVLALIAACASAPVEQFYRLPGVPSAAAAQPAGGAVIAVGAVTVPDLIDRPQFVTLGPGSRVEIAETHRWAEPLKLAIGRVVAGQLSAALALPLVYAYPQVGSSEPALRVTLHVQRFDAEPGRRVSDELLWSVRRLSDGQIRAGRSAAQVAVTEPGHAGLPAAHAAALQAISADIARAAAELLAR